MIKYTLGSHGLGSARFAISPVLTLSHMLFVFHDRPHQLDPALRRRLATALRDNDLRLVTRLLLGNRGGYTPGFLDPPLRSFDADLHSELHHLASSPADRIGNDICHFLRGTAPTRTAGMVSRPDAITIADALKHGETQLAHTLAGQLHHLWDTVLASAWPALHAAMEADIAQRSTTIAHDGYITMISQMCPTLTWCEGSLHIARSPARYPCPRPEPHRHAETIIFTPSAFTPTSVPCIDPGKTLTVRYPLPRRPAAPAGSIAAIVGQTRGEILSALAAPRSTQQLALELHLTPGTISYHLQLLHHAGLITRTRQSRQVLYQRYQPASVQPLALEPQPPQARAMLEQRTGLRTA
jgi:DNA-binding transcriptional ArsR family regulator